MALEPIIKDEFEDDNVETHLNKIVDSNSDVMKAARSRGVGQAAQRGLRNSSLAGQSGEYAVIREAADLAKFNAGMAGQRNLSKENAYHNRVSAREGFGYNTDLSQQQIDGTAARDAKGFEYSTALQGQDIEGRQAIQEADLLSREGMQDKDIASREGMQATDITSKEGMQDKDILSREGMQDKDITSKEQINIHGKTCA